MNSTTQPKLARTLTADQIDALDRDGYIVVAAALDMHTLAELHKAFDVTSETSGTQHVVIDEVTPGGPAWEALTRHSLVLEAGRLIFGRPFHVRDVHGRNPLPGFGQQGLHSDWRPRAPDDPYFAATAIFMLDSFCSKNGATRVVPVRTASRRRWPSLTRSLSLIIPTRSSSPETPAAF